MRSRLVLAFLVLATWHTPSRAADDVVTGRWTFDFDVAAYEEGTPLARGPRSGGEGTPATPTPKTARVVLDLNELPGGVVLGSVTGIQSTQGSGAGFSQGTVEIAAGRVSNGHLAFRVWRFDQIGNFMKVEGRLADDALELTLSREGNPPYSVTVKATRLSGRAATTL